MNEGHLAIEIEYAGDLTALTLSFGTMHADLRFPPGGTATMFERLLEPGSRETPNCACGEAMRFLRIERKSADAAVKHFRCDSCSREMFLMVWPEAIADAA